MIDWNINERLKWTILEKIIIHQKRQIYFRYTNLHFYQISEQAPIFDGIFVFCKQIFKKNCKNIDHGTFFRFFQIQIWFPEHLPFLEVLAFYMYNFLVLLRNMLYFIKLFLKKTGTIFRSEFSIIGKLFQCHFFISWLKFSVFLQQNLLFEVKTSRKYIVVRNYLHDR